MADRPMTLGALAATFALAQDNAYGQPLESQLRSCLLAAWLCEQAGFDRAQKETAYWVALLRYISCTGMTHEAAAVFGDEILYRAQMLIQDAGNPREVFGDVVTFASARHPPEERDAVLAYLKDNLRAAGRHMYASAVEVADMLLARLGFGADVREALACTFERWNGVGSPRARKGEDIPLAMRVVHLSHDMEAICRRLSPNEAIAAARNRRDRTYDPHLVDVFVEHGMAWFDRLAALEPWDAVLALEPSPRRMLADADLDAALEVVADFVDLKSVHMRGHSRRCAELGRDAARALNLDTDAMSRVYRAGLVHDLGITAIPNSIWDKPGTLTQIEHDLVARHTLITEQMLRPTPALAALGPIAASHHERADGSGYHKGIGAAALSPEAYVLAAADVFVGMTSDRTDRSAIPASEAVTELRRLAAERRLDQRAVEAVIAAAGHGDGPSPRPSRAPNPAGLSDREIEVLRLAALGMTTKSIGEKLFISPKTTDRHIQNVYAKTGVSTRAAAALWAMQSGVLE